MGRAGRWAGARPVPFREESRAQVGQRGQDRAEPVPGEAGHGRVPARPEDAISNFFLAGSYTKQDYIDSMEGATLSGRQCAARLPEAAAGLSKAAAKQTTSAAA